MIGLATRLRSPALGAAAASAVVVAVLAVVEAIARALPPPRVQVVPLDDRVVLQDGVPTWRVDPVRENHGCAEPSAVLMGSSIFFGSGLEAADSLGPALERHLGGCVQNHAQPAYTFANQLAVARRVLPPLHPEVVFWEIWQNSLNGWVVAGAAYNLGDLATDSLGLPNPFGLPPALNRRLFTWSALYRQLDLSRAAPVPGLSDVPRWRALMAGPATEAHDLVQASGARLVWVLMPPLDRPFAESAGAYPEVRAHGDAVIDVAQVLAGRDPAGLRLDTCCHWNAAGQQVLAHVLAKGQPDAP